MSIVSAAPNRRTERIIHGTAVYYSSPQLHYRSDLRSKHRRPSSCRRNALVNLGDKPACTYGRTLLLELNHPSDAGLHNTGLSTRVISLLSCLLRLLPAA